ncbi:hypothetical protein CAPTEDRAFT_199484 [Capitella teleta]|uniref:SET domain-containing protein n=1 Tax=Capitella teleta TaxID=283909 RepID=R7V7R7_CAPTE|nr:hypothetical protein CAPTEDRAFT_199484 [Capitella teleta]|eukprot:ELU14532.1 hypothetical protein CAPTEDRAFT_199484 [Capitella teleta]
MPIPASLKLVPERPGRALHKLECRAFQETGSVPTREIRLIFRTLIKLQSGCEEVQVFGRTRKWGDLMSRKFGHSHTCQEDYVNGSERTTLKSSIMAFYLSQISVNSITINHPQAVGLGVGLYLRFSAVDHSCRPNAFANFEGTKVCVRCIEPIEDEKDLRISYVSPLDDTATRRKNLLQKYLFECTCEACLDIDQDQMKFSFKCVRGGCKGHMTRMQDNRFRCDYCGEKQVTEDEIQTLNVAVEKTRRMMDISKKLKAQGRYAEIMVAGFACLKDAVDFLHSDNLLIVELRDCLLNACRMTQNWSVEAIQCGIANLEPYRSFYGRHHPALAILLYDIGDGYLTLNPRKAAKYLQQVRANCATSLLFFPGVPQLN